MAAGKKKAEERQTGIPDSTRSLRDDAIEQLAGSPKRSPGLKEKTLEQLIHELEVHQVELETQAEELRMAHLALEGSRDKYLDLYDFAPIGYLTLSDKALITEVNLSGATLLGADRKELLNARFRKFIAEKDSEQWDPYFLNVLDRGEKLVCTLMLKRGDGSVFPARLEGIRLTGHDGAIAVRIAFSDISDIWQIEALQRKTATLSILNDIISTVNMADNLPGLLNRILDESLRLLDFDAGGIYLVNHASRTAEIVHSKNIPLEFLDGIRTIPIDPEPYRTIFIQNEPIITENYDTFAPGQSKISGLLSMASIPLLSKGVAVGALNIGSQRRQVISNDEKQVLISIGRELGSTIDRMVTEEEVKKARKNLETLFDSIDEMVFVLDMQGRILTVNNTVSKRLSYSPWELTGMDVLLLHVPERRNEALKNVQGMIAGTIDSCPVPVLTKDGTRIEVETKVTHGRWNNQEVLIGVSRDVTKRKRTEDALTESKERFDQLAEQSNTITWEVDPDGLYTYVSHVSMAVWGYRPDELVGKMYFYDLHPVSGREAFKASCFAVFARKESFRDLENAIQFRDGSVVWVSTNGIPLLNADGTMRGYRGSDTDITDRKVAEEGLRRSELLLRSVIESPQSIIIFSLDQDYRYLAFNAIHQETMKAIWGVDIRPGTNMLDVIGYESDRKKAQQNFDRALAGEHFMLTEEYGDEVLGRKTWENTYSPIYDENHQAIGLTVYVIDVTERKRAEEALRLSEEKYRMIVETAIEGIISLDIGARITFVNRQMASKLGYSMEEMLGQPFRTFLAEDQLPDHDAQMKIRAQGKDAVYERCFKRKDGGMHWALISSRAIIGPSGTFTGSFAMLTDITERKVAEEEIKRQSGLIKSLLDSIPDIIFFKDVTGVYLGCNPPFAEFVGKSREEIVGKTDYDLFDTEIADFFRGHDKHMLDLGITHHNEEWITYPDGRKILIDTLKTPYWGPDETLIGIIGISRDITGRKRAENAVLEANKKLNILNSITRHDVLNQISVLVMTLELIE
ncbi:MAG: PAS domain S-box protein, partial [Methanomicrobiales archaeon]